MWKICHFFYGSSLIIKAMNTYNVSYKMRRFQAPHIVVERALSNASYYTTLPFLTIQKEYSALLYRKIFYVSKGISRCIDVSDTEVQLNQQGS